MAAGLGRPIGEREEGEAGEETGGGGGGENS